jgi:hypothetical protein
MADEGSGTATGSPIVKTIASAVALLSVHVYTPSTAPIEARALHSQIA